MLAAGALVLSLACGIAAPAVAQPQQQRQPKAPVDTAGTAAPGEAAAATVRSAVDAWLNGRFKVDEVRKTPVPGIWEVRVGTDLMYADETGQYVFVEGQLVETRTNRSLTQERLEQVTAIQWKDLPLNLALKQVNGKGERRIAVFEDPNCPHCRTTRRALNAIDNLTIYTFTLPILAADSDRKVRQVWCSADRNKAWNELMVEGRAPSNAGDCATPVEKIVELGRRLRVTATPTLFFASGRRYPGGASQPVLEKLLEQHSKAP